MHVRRHAPLARAFSDCAAASRFEISWMPDDLCTLSVSAPRGEQMSKRIDGVEAARVGKRQRNINLQLIDHAANRRFRAANQKGRRVAPHGAEGNCSTGGSAVKTPPGKRVALKKTRELRKAHYASVRLCRLLNTRLVWSTARWLASSASPAAMAASSLRCSSSMRVGRPGFVSDLWRAILMKL